MKVAVIPARGGSKRIPRKNIKNFSGKPMISYAIKTALNSNLFSRVIVTSDDKEILKVANDEGAETPFIRSKELSDDFTPTVPVINDCISKINEDNLIEEVCCIYPCVPFLSVDDLINSYTVFSQDRENFCFPVLEYPSSIHRALKFDKKEKLQPVNKKNELIRTQDLEKAYYDAGQFYWGRTETWLKNDELHSGSSGFILDGSRFLDIDTKDDWEKALIMKEILIKLETGYD